MPGGDYTFEQADTIQKGVTPVVSVLVPVYNAEHTLQQALDSIRTQSLSNIEILCIDDGSTDGSAEILKRCGDSRISRLWHHGNQGYGAAMNHGLDVASGQWVAIVEPDDYILPRMLETLVDAAYEHGDVDIVKSPYYRMIRENGTKRGDEPEIRRECSYRHRIHARGAFDMSDEKAAHLLRHHPSIWSAIYSKNFLGQNHIGFVEYPGSGWADNEFFYETLLRAKRIVYVDEAFYCYREETDEEFEAFARKNPRLPFDRWHSMQDIIDELGAGEAVKRSHISRGFTYLDGVSRAMGESDPVVLDEMGKMFDRMDAGLVASEFQLPPDAKKLFFEYSNGDWNEQLSTALYLAGLAGEAVYAARNNGLKFTVDRTKRYIKDRMR